MTTDGPGGSEPDVSSTDPGKEKRELIVVVHPGARLDAFGTELRSHASIDLSPLADLLSREGIALYPIFDSDEEAFRARSAGHTADTSTRSPELSLFFQVAVPDDRMEDIAKQLRTLTGIVDAAYIKPAADLPFPSSSMTESDESAPHPEVDLSARQKYLNEAPGGIDARFAWSVCGGKGRGVRIIDIEFDWRFSHEDLQQNLEGLLGGTPSGNSREINHGTAVLGIIGGDHNCFGINGICPDANVGAISVLPDACGWGTAGAIKTAADMLGPGGIILIELQRVGPIFNFGAPRGEQGRIPIEWWPCDLWAIKHAVNRGIIVVEAGANGWEDLDDPIYDRNPSDPNRRFPSWWQNPFRRNPVDSGAIIVGAGTPPPNALGYDLGPDRSRLNFSNYGSMFDAQAWGKAVTTTGYGQLGGNPDEDRWYTHAFGGTSSAAAIVAGALGCVQGALCAAGQPLLTPTTARGLLRSTGSPQEDSPCMPRSQRIGNRPDLRQMIGRLIPSTPVI